MIVPEGSPNEFKEIADQIKQLSRKHDFFFPKLKENIVPNKLKPFNIKKFQEVYTNPNDSPNIILIATDTNEKSTSTSPTDATNSTSVDAPNNPAIAFLLGILSSKRPNTMLFQKDMRDASVAASEIETDKLPFFYIQYLLVHEKYRGSDVGLNIVCYALDSAANCFPSQYDTLICEVEAKQSARDFWKKAGFKELPGRPDDPDGVVLGKTVKRVKRVSTSIENALVLKYDSIEPVLGALVECFGRHHMNDLEKGEKEDEETGMVD